MATVTETIDIRAPIDRVFAALTDPRRAGEWNPNIVDVTLPAPMPVQVGTSWEQTAMMMGKKARLRCRIVQFDTPFFGRLEVSGDHRALITTTCTSIEGGTRVTQTVEFVPPGGLFGSMAAAVIAPMLQHEVQRTMQRARDSFEWEADRGSRTT